MNSAVLLNRREFFRPPPNDQIANLSAGMGGRVKQVSGSRRFLRNGQLLACMYRNESSTCLKVFNLVLSLHCLIFTFLRTFQPAVGDRYAFTLFSVNPRRMLFPHAFFLLFSKRIRQRNNLVQSGAEPDSVVGFD